MSELTPKPDMDLAWDVVSQGAGLRKARDWSSFDSWLREEGIYESVTVMGLRRALMREVSVRLSGMSILRSLDALPACSNLVEALGNHRIHRCCTHSDFPFRGRNRSSQRAVADAFSLFFPLVKWQRLGKSPEEWEYDPTLRGITHVSGKAPKCQTKGCIPCN